MKPKFLLLWAGIAVIGAVLICILFTTALRDPQMQKFEVEFQGMKISHERR